MQEGTASAACKKVVSLFPGGGVLERTVLFANMDLLAAESPRDVTKMSTRPCKIQIDGISYVCVVYIYIHYHILYTGHARAGDFCDHARRMSIDCSVAQ